MPRYLDPKADLTFKRIFGEYSYLLINMSVKMVSKYTGFSNLQIEVWNTVF